MTDDRWIVPPYSVSGVQELVDKASRAIQELAASLPHDIAGAREMDKFLATQRDAARDFFRDAPG